MVFEPEHVIEQEIAPRIHALQSNSDARETSRELNAGPIAIIFESSEETPDLASRTTFNELADSSVSGVSLRNENSLNLRRASSEEIPPVIQTEDDIPPLFTDSIPSKTGRVGASLYIELPHAFNGNGALSYRITPSLPEGLSITADQEHDRYLLEGRPTTSQWHQTYTWIASDSDDNTSSSDEASRSFTIGIKPTFKQIHLWPADQTVIMSWIAPADSAVTHWQYAHTPDVEDVEVAPAWSNFKTVPNSNALTRGYRVTGLTNGVLYKFKLRPVTQTSEGTMYGDENLVYPSVAPSPNIPNQAPEILDKPDNVRSIEENSANNTNVGAAFTATDRELDTLSWTLSGSSLFSIDNGQVKVAGALDYESSSSHSITISVSDGTDSDSLAVTVNVTNIDEAGTVTLSSNSPQVGTPLSADLTDPDGSVSGLSWSWHRSDDGSTGWQLISGANSSSYTPVNTDNSKYLRATASYTDGHGSGKTANRVSAAVSTEPNEAPEIEGPSTLTRTVREDSATNSNVGAALRATDADGDSLTWTLSGSSLFSVSNGQVRVAGPLDYETSSSHSLTVSVSDGTSSDSVSMTVNVTNVDEAGTVTLSSNSPQIGTSLSATLTDPDGSVSNTSWSWQRSDDGSTGWSAISGATLSTYTSTTDDAGKYLRATTSYSDGHGSGKSALSGAVYVESELGEESPNNPPAIIGPTAVSYSIAENAPIGTSIGTSFSASDLDGDQILWSLVGADGLFSIDAGLVKVAGTLDYETATSHELTVQANDGVTSTAVSLTVNIENVDEPGAVALQPSPPRVKQTLTATVSDPDRSITGTTWSWHRSSDGLTDWIEIASSSSTYIPNNDDAGMYLRAHASYADGHGPNKTAQQVTSVVLEPLNTPPTITDTPMGVASRSVFEDAVIGSPVGDPFVATDSQDDELTWSFSAESDVFTIDGGQINVAALLDYEQILQYTLTVVVSDGQSSDSVQVTVSVLNVDETGTLTITPTNPVVGQVVTTRLSDGDGSISDEAWVWSKSQDGTSDWQVIGEATSTTYTPTELETGLFLRVSVTYSDGHGSGKTAQAISDAVDSYPMFPDDEISDQIWPVAQQIDPLVLPIATGGNSPLEYALTPVLPTGLSFNQTDRSISGTPSTVTSKLIYTYSVTDDDLDSDSLMFSITIEPSAPHPPPQVSLETGDGEIVVTWDTPFDGGASIVGYEIEWTESDDQDWSNASNHRVFGETNTSFTITEVKEGTSYIVRCRASNDVGEGEWSVVVEIITLDGRTLVYPKLTLSILSRAALTIMDANALAVSGRIDRHIDLSNGLPTDAAFTSSLIPTLPEDPAHLGTFIPSQRRQVEGGFEPGFMVMDHDDYFANRRGGLESQLDHSLVYSEFPFARFAGDVDLFQRFDFWSSQSYHKLWGDDNNGIDWQGGIHSQRFGVDRVVAHKVLTGAAFNVSKGRFEWDGVNPINGRDMSGLYKLSVKEITPYAGWISRDETANTWTLMGFSQGDVVVSQDDRDELETSDFDLRGFALGSSKSLWTDRNSLSTKAHSLRIEGDAIFVNVDLRGSDFEDGFIEPMQSENRRLRVAFELNREQTLTDHGYLNRSLSLGIRNDVRDDFNFTAGEMTFGITYANLLAGIDLDSKLQLVTASNDQSDEWTVDIRMAYDHGRRCRGWMVDARTGFKPPSSIYGVFNDAFNPALSTQSRESEFQVGVNLRYGFVKPETHEIFEPYISYTVLGDDENTQVGGRWHVGSRFSLSAIAERREYANMTNDRFWIQGVVNLDDSMNDPTSSRVNSGSTCSRQPGATQNWINRASGDSLPINTRLSDGQVDKVPDAVIESSYAMQLGAFSTRVRAYIAGEAIKETLGSLPTNQSFKLNYSNTEPDSLWRVSLDTRFTNLIDAKALCEQFEDVGLDCYVKKI